MSKGGMQAGQGIILTKALGTGTIMAAAMRRKAKARWISGSARLLHTYTSMTNNIRGRPLLCPLPTFHYLASLDTTTLSYYCVPAVLLLVTTVLLLCY